MAKKHDLEKTMELLADGQQDEVSIDECMEVLSHLTGIKVDSLRKRYRNIKEGLDVTDLTPEDYEDV